MGGGAEDALRTVNYSFGDEFLLRDGDQLHERHGRLAEQNVAVAIVGAAIPRGAAPHVALSPTRQDDWLVIRKCDIKGNHENYCHRRPHGFVGGLRKNRRRRPYLACVWQLGSGGLAHRMRS